MTERRPEFDSDFDAELEKYIDQEMTDQQLQDFVEGRKQKQLRAEMELQERIDESLARVFRFAPADSAEVPAAPPEPVTRPHAEIASASPSKADAAARDDRRAWWTRAAILAATLAAISLFFVWQRQSRRSQQVAFEPRRLVEIYESMVERGFQPFYRCDDMQRFAATFEQRLGVALTLLPMPNDRMMLGLSYPGGLSRQTTAMLCEVNGEPVVVFVDRATKGLAQAEQAADTELHVFSENQFGLVFYEVTLLDQPTMIEYFALPEVQ